MNKPSPKLHILTSDRKLVPFADQIKTVANETIKQVKKLLSFKESVDVVVYRYFANDPEFATSGYTPTGNVLWIYTDPAQKGYKQLLPKQLKRVLSHELHHAVRTQRVGVGKTLRDVLVFEGLAAHFELEVCGGEPTGFYTKFSESQLKELFTKAKKDLDNPQYSYDDWFFGNAARGIPKHAGYGMAYSLVGKALRGRKPSGLVSKKTGQIL